MHERETFFDAASFCWFKACSALSLGATRKLHGYSASASPFPTRSPATGRGVEESQYFRVLANRTCRLRAGDFVHGPSPIETVDLRGNILQPHIQKLADVLYPSTPPEAILTTFTTK